MIHQPPLHGNVSCLQFPENSKLDFLLGLVEGGCHIFPLHLIVIEVDGRKRCSCGSQSSCTGIGKHPMGRWSIPLDPENPRTAAVIRAHLEKWPNRGWGIHLGLSRLVCVDVDPRNGGLESLRQLIDAGVLPDVPPQVVTGSGGFHFYFLAPANVDERTGWRGPNGQSRCSVLLAPGIDFLAGQHFMVLAHSPHASGGSYTWNPATPIGDMPSSLVDRVNSRPAFEGRPRSAQSDYQASAVQGAPPTEQTLKAALAYVMTCEPATCDGTSGKKAGRVARILTIDFGLSRPDAKRLFIEWSEICRPPWSDAEIERKLDYGEAGLGTRGWRNRVRDGGLTNEEKEITSQFAEIPIGWGRRLLNVTTGEIFDESQLEEATEKTYDPADNLRGAMRTIDDFETEEASFDSSGKPCCPHLKGILLKHRRKRTGRAQYFPCRRLDCPACFAVKKQWYIDTMRHHLFRWEQSHGKEECPPLFTAVITREQWKRIAARLRRRNANFFRLGIDGMGSIDPSSFLVVSTESVTGPAWSEASPAEASLLLEESVLNLPADLRRRVWWSSRPWKLLQDDPEPKKEWRRVGKISTQSPAVRRVLEAWDIDVETVHGGGRRWPWHADQFRFEPDDWADLKNDLDAGAVLSGPVSWNRHSSDEEFVPDLPPELVPLSG